MIADVLGTLLTVLINAFIGITIFWMLFWDSDPRNPIRKHFIPKIQRVFIWLGLDCQWRMFAPDPPQRTIWPMAKLTMKNMDVVSWEPSHYGRNSVLQNLRYKKFIKYYQEAVRPQSGVQIKRDFVEYLLRKKLHEQPCIKVEVYLVAEPARPFNGSAGDLVTSKQLVYTFHPGQDEQ